ncbi:hypothetical protein OC846_005897 [Tilletia horrida]|uniref:Uncharacterized protein n=1 Tax=Tilletia horrida TaxID=155126 RepID=A0AAN6GJN5_9BASI|nr:hypothetical protein OC846_005897 [Tilletia horrida]KAK0560970.1 hypothetical protein OC861_006041 [Tilletia horrida]
MAALDEAGANTTRALTTPRILAGIMEHLQRDRADLWTCCRVSKLWRDTAHPFIMRHLNVPFHKGRTPLSDYGRRTRYHPKHVHTIRLYDDSIQSIYLSEPAADLICSMPSWRSDPLEPTSLWPEQQFDSGLHKTHDTLDNIQKAGATPRVELVFGIISSVAVERMLAEYPVVLQSISAVLVMCDFSRKMDYAKMDHTLRPQLNQRFPIWFSQLTSLLQRICAAQKEARRLKDVRILTPYKFSKDIKAATNDDVITAFNSICEGLEVLSFRATDMHVTPAAVKEVLKMTFPRLRSFTFRFAWPQAAEAGVHALSSWVDDFLDRHQELAVIHIETGAEILALRQTFLRLRSLTLSKTTVHTLESFLSRHRDLHSVSIDSFETPSDFDSPTVKFENLPTVLSWKLDFRILSKLLSRGVSIKMASATGLQSLEDWTIPVDAPVPLERRNPLPSITYLLLDIDSDDLLPVLIQLGSSFHYTRYPNLRELRLIVDSGKGKSSSLKLHKDPTEAAKCLQLVFSGLSTAVSLNALSLAFFPATSLPQDSLLNQIAQNPPPRLQHMTWRATTEGKSQTYTVVQEDWANGQWNRRYLRTTSRTHIAEGPGQSTVGMDPDRPFLDHSCDPPALPPVFLPS